MVGRFSTIVGIANLFFSFCCPLKVEVFWSRRQSRTGYENTLQSELLIVYKRCKQCSPILHSNRWLQRLPKAIFARRFAYVPQNVNAVHVDRDSVNSLNIFFSSPPPSTLQHFTTGCVTLEVCFILGSKLGDRVGAATAGRTPVAVASP